MLSHPEGITYGEFKNEVLRRIFEAKADEVKDE
jgi:hypothetical protein